MTNLAILCCLDANDVCTGAGCLRALRELPEILRLALERQASA